MAAISATAQPEWRPAKAQSKLLDQNWSVDTGGAEAAFDLCFKDVKDGRSAVRKMYERAVNVPVELWSGTPSRKNASEGAALSSTSTRTSGWPGRSRGDDVRPSYGRRQQRLSALNPPMSGHGLRFYFNREAQLCEHLTRARLVS